MATIIFSDSPFATLLTSIGRFYLFSWYITSMRLVLVAISLMFIRWSMLQIYAKYLVRATFLSPLASKRLLCSVDSPCGSTFYFSVRSFNVFLIFFWPIYVRRTTHLHLKIECCDDDYFFRFTVCYTFDLGWSVLSFLMIHNVQGYVMDEAIAKSIIIAVVLSCF